MLPTVDLAVLLIYLAGVVFFGCWFVRKSNSTAEFTAAGRSLPGWAVGLSIFGTYLSSNTFIGVPGKAFGSNWNAFVFSLSLPIAALIAVRYFVPFYRRSGEISAYHHLEKRFGPWARAYVMILYLLVQMSRVAVILFGVALAMQPLTGWPMPVIIIGAGVLITVYTVMGGIEAVIWTDVVQSIVLTVGAVVVLVVLLMGMPEGPVQAIEIAAEKDKFSLGSFGPSLAESTFWVVLLFGLFENIKNFGIDQSFVQRYHTAKDDRAARKSVWLGALLYVPVSLMFFSIGTAAFSYYQTHPDELQQIRQVTAKDILQSEQTTASVVISEADIAEKAASLTDKEIGDKVLPHFIVNALPPGLAGLLIAAIFAAAMSSIDTSLNSSATIIYSDIWKRYVNPEISERSSMRVLYTTTIIFGLIGTAAALAMIGVKSVLDIWWTLSGAFAGGMVGLFLLGLIVKRAGNTAAKIAVTIGTGIMLWMTFSPKLDDSYVWVRSPFHGFMTIIIGTLSIFLIGLLLARFSESPRESG